MDEMDTNYNPYNYTPNVKEVLYGAPFKYDPITYYGGWQPGQAIAETRKTMVYAVVAIVTLILLIGGLAVVANLKK